MELVIIDGGLLRKLAGVYIGTWYIKFLVLIDDAIKRNIHEINKLIKCNRLEIKARIDTTVSMLFTS